MEYEEFLRRKSHLSGDFGFEATWYPDIGFDFQNEIISRACKKGRYGIFADTGLGKTLIQLSVAQNIVQKTNGRVLILTPLAVASQFLKEAEKIGVGDIEHSKDGKFTKIIILCNYERLHYFNPSDFEGIILDESSILKNFDGKIKSHLTEFSKKIKYRFLFTATPSPNDYIELGTSSEILGYMGYMDMLSRFFKNNNNSIDIRHSGDEWYLKPHAENSFWQWVKTWSVSMRKPAGIGFSDKGYSLPKLHEIQTIVRNDSPLIVNNQYSLFNKQAQNFFEIKAEVRQTINSRCEKAVSKLSDCEIGIYWVNLNDEAKIIKGLDKDSIEISGSMSIDKKEEILTAFSNSEIKKLITKTSITAFGLNWQHCNRMAYFPTFSYEQYYQAVRRLWRFGQKNEVTVDLILSDGQTKVMNSLLIKKQKARTMFEKLAVNTNNSYSDNIAKFDKNINFPNFLKVQNG